MGLGVRGKRSWLTVFCLLSSVLWTGCLIFKKMEK
jgi:hypothetical protein